MTKIDGGQGIRGPEGSGNPEKKRMKPTESIKKTHCTVVDSLRKREPSLALEPRARDDRQLAESFDHSVDLKKSSSASAPGLRSLGKIDHHEPKAPPHKKHKGS